MSGDSELIFLTDFLLPDSEEIETKQIANDALVFFVHQNNALLNLELEQLSSIYSGTITNWCQVGGSAQTIRAYQRPNIQYSQTYFEQFMNDHTPIDPIVHSRIDMSSDQPQVAIYENFEKAIGFSFYSNMVQMIDGMQVKFLELGQTEAAGSINASINYPLTIPIHAVYLSENASNQELSSFID